VGQSIGIEETNTFHFKFGNFFNDENNTFKLKYFVALKLWESQFWVVFGRQSGPL